MLFTKSFERKILDVMSKKMFHVMQIEELPIISCLIKFGKWSYINKECFTLYINIMSILH